MIPLFEYILDVSKKCTQVYSLSLNTLMQQILLFHIPETCTNNLRPSLFDFCSISEERQQFISNFISNKFETQGNFFT